MKRTTPEGAVLKAVTDLLTLEKVWWMRCNTGTHVLTGPNGRKRVFRAGRPGMADLLAIRRGWIGSGDGCCSGKVVAVDWDGCCPTCGADGRGELQVIWIECKRPGGVQSDAQKAFQAEVEAEGHYYRLVSDVTKLQAWLKVTG